jgi:murein DD-endopeptidase MepM/ murein hydrolase activator NlpD
MISKLFRSVGMFAAVLVLGFIGFRVGCYFTHSEKPHILVEGLAPEGHYADTVSCNLVSHNGYKFKFLNAKLDGAPYNFQQSQVLGKKSFTHPFELDTTTLANGQHTLEIEAIDGSYNKNKTKITLNFSVDNTPLQGSFLQPQYEVLQGRTVHAIINTNKDLDDATVSYLTKKYPCCKTADHATTYECFIPIECEQGAEEHPLKATLTDKTGKTVALISKVLVKAAQFPRQKGFSVAQEKLDNEKDVSLNNDILKTALTKWIHDSPREKLWRGHFEMPCEITRISTPFGEVRTTPERGRYLHKAIDIVHHPRSVVWACARGKIIIKERYLMSGNTIVVDHGMGVHSHYYHLDDFADLEVGDMVEKGAKVGRLGKTGYATGYHLHWEIRVNNTAVDPIEWTTKSF